MNGTFISAAGSGAIASQTGQAEYQWMVDQGADPTEAIKRIGGATMARWVYGFFAAQWLLVWYIIGCVLLFISTPAYFMKNWLQWEMPEFTSGFGAPEKWVGGAEFGPQFVFSLLGALACFGMIYLALLGFAHIWRWESNVIPGYNDNKKWWRFYKRPVLNTIYGPGDPNRQNVRYKFATGAKWAMLYVPAMLIAAFYIMGTATTVAMVAVHNVL